MSAGTRSRLTEMNRYDMELYEWVRERFAQQISSRSNQTSRARSDDFETLNAAAQKLYGTTPDPVRKLASRMLYARPAA